MICGNKTLYCDKCSTYIRKRYYDDHRKNHADFYTFQGKDFPSNYIPKPKSKNILKNS